ncbi:MULTISPECIES: MlaD family protein [Mycobacteroides]|uniref:Mammalian cell entry protein n=1 Tax=Mycobacteroides chelonae TaxID=1774 RepID=A0A1S1LVZ8_MYCCH|nr:MULTISPECIES: MCE family protein [Mycobacteroides]KRQ19283.1 hypothetical protein AOT87_26685 [Mycobacteroides sp. H003]KRQ34524.1 hypothetical protein AOT91_06435 [Mycobacteroides sp. H092]KRQ41507.1 hypothetical protein AOT92_12205 [Mycobacteroides sp. H101]KRQ43461.1 hypothetical protein AOT88_24225 [Mycobacteroides sp. H063]KRQ58093.1 hypothetical protein AOT94_14505 [Mycobacteroides sp. HXVII]
MPNSFDPNSRGASDGRLAAYGSAVIVLVTLVTTVLLAKSTGRLEHTVRVTAELRNVGDGLPARSDVKYRGMLVGRVTDVTPAVNGRPNLVQIDLKPQSAQSIPNTVTARVVPSNIFAVSSIQLVEHGSGLPLRGGDALAEDSELSTVLFQSTVSKLRDILLSTGRTSDGDAVGLLDTLATATENRGKKLVASGAQLERLLDQLNAVVTTSTSVSNPSTLSALLNAVQGLKSTAPALIDALHEAVIPMRTFAEKREQLSDLLSGGTHTLGTLRTGLDNHADQLITISTDITPVLGVFAERHDAIPNLANMAKGLSDKFIEQVWDPEKQQLNAKVIVSFTPSTLYTREDCPRYGELEGPSCATAPPRKPGGVTPDIARYATPDLPPQLLPDRYIPPPGLAPPASPDQSPTALAPASFGGNIGPIGSQHERNQISEIVGFPATTATQLLMGPLARGTRATVSRLTKEAK